MADSHKNFAYSLVATAPNPAISGTSLVVTAGQGALFPTVPFNVVIWATGAQPITTNAEIVRVTNISTDTFTIVRTQENTSARTIIVGDQIAAAITVKTLTDAESTNIKETEIDFGTPAKKTKKFTITDADVTALSQIIANQSGKAATGKSQDENEMDYIACRVAPGTGQFTLYTDAIPGPVIGKFLINYLIG